jgi:hypothetical protein
MSCIQKIIVLRLSNVSIFALTPEISPPGPEFGRLTHERFYTLDLIRYADVSSI